MRSGWDRPWDSREKRVPPGGCSALVQVGGDGSPFVVAAKREKGRRVVLKEGASALRSVLGCVHKQDASARVRRSEAAARCSRSPQRAPCRHMPRTTTPAPVGAGLGRTSSLRPHLLVCGREKVISSCLQPLFLVYSFVSPVPCGEGRGWGEMASVPCRCPSLRPPKAGPLQAEASCVSLPGGSLGCGSALHSGTERAGCAQWSVSP